MTDRYTERFGRFGKSITRGAGPPASACPRCFLNGVSLGFQTGTDTLVFECRCGTRWLTTGKQAKAHAIWLQKRSNHSRQQSDL